jgi:superfamily I DNA/RNA helicase
MHRSKGPEYQRLAVVGARDGVLPRASVIERFRDDPAHRWREERKPRSLLFVAATRARDTLRISGHGRASPYVPIPTHGHGSTCTTYRAHGDGMAGGARPR